LCSSISFDSKLAVGKLYLKNQILTKLARPLNVLPNFMAQLLQARVALERLSSFFSEEEVDSFVSSLKQPPPALPSDSIPIETSTLGITGRARFMWNTVEQPNPNPKITVVATADSEDEDETAESPVDEGRFELKDIAVIFPPGKLTLVTGATASGKTALLLALLGEMTPSPFSPPSAQVHLPKYPGSVLDEYGLRSTVSYAAQTPWLEHLSIRENVLFGNPFEEERYWKVIECCALAPDLAMLEDGDATEIGERGINLSGGQKARVALARAVYARSRCVLLDDPLSAVDSHTARFLFERLFQGELLKHRTVVRALHPVVPPGIL
jgi:ABC-type multidrug transport system fused ATPase/permease subunit